MSSIPYDPGLVLGNLVHPRKIEQLMDIANANKPMDLANERMNNLLQANHKIGMIYNEILSMDSGKMSRGLEKLLQQKQQIKNEMTQAAMAFARETITAEHKVRQLKLKAGQTRISTNIETPMCYIHSKIRPIDISFDTIQFDVQYFHKNEVKDNNESFSSQVSAHVQQMTSQQRTPYTTSGYFDRITTTQSTEVAASASNQLMIQQKFSNLEGTIVISASTTHKSANIMDPFVMDARKAVTAWNYTFPEDRLETDPSSIVEAATKQRSRDDGVLHLLSGYTKGSSFVGFVHIQRTEHSRNEQEAESVAASIKQSLQYDSMIYGLMGSMGGVSSSTARNAQSLLSGSQISNHCSLNVMGCIPNISPSDMATTIDTMRPDPAEVLGQLGAIQNSTDGSVNKSMDSTARDGRAGRAFIELNNQHLSNSISAVSQITENNNKVIDNNSMMRAFDDYLKMAEQGQVGVPINFYVKEITKAEVAKTYIRRFYPNGATGAKAAIRGQLGQDDPDKEDAGDR